MIEVLSKAVSELKIEEASKAVVIGYIQTNEWRVDA